MSSPSASPENTLKRVQSALSSASWTSGIPLDQLSHYRSIGVRSTRIQTFKPSPASEQVLMKGVLTAKGANPVISGSALHRLTAEGKALMKELPEFQISWRSRPAGLMSSRLQLNELTRRVDTAKENASLLRSISLPPNIAEEINSVKKDAILKRFEFNMDNILHYIDDHKRSSIAPGLKWEQLPRDENFWKPIYEEVKGFFEEYVFSGQSWNTPFNFGMRARQDQEVQKDQIFYDLEVTRTRIVMFHPALSMPFAFVPDKTGFYRDVMTGALDALEINDHVMTPLTDGGEVYGAAADALHNNEDVTIVLGDDCNIFRNGTQYAFDGANWETQVGTLLGEPFRGSKTYFGGMYHVPSGVFDTILDDTLATLWVYSMLPEMKEGVGIPGVMEREHNDEKCNFMLGMSYAEDPNQPRLQGLKLTVDKTDAAEILPSGRSLELKNNYDEDQTLRWYLAYHGTTPDGGSLLDFLEKLEPGFPSGFTEQYVIDGEVPTTER